jgi:hypothetical protein
MTRPLRPENDNRPSDPAERHIGRSLANRVVVDHLFVGLPAMLEARGVSEAVRESVTDFLKPLVGMLDRWERESIDFARSTRLPTADVFDGLFTTLEAFGDEFERLARTPDQRREAMNFQRFVGDVSAAICPERLPVAIEIEEHDNGARLARHAPQPANENDRPRGRGR